MKKLLIICCLAGVFGACSSNFLKEYSQDLAKVESLSDLDEVLLGKGYLPWGRLEATTYAPVAAINASFQAATTCRMNWLLTHEAI